MTDYGEIGVKALENASVRDSLMLSLRHIDKGDVSMASRYARCARAACETRDEAAYVNAFWRHHGLVKEMA